MGTNNRHQPLVNKPPWATGLAVATMIAVVVGLAVSALFGGVLTVNRWLAIILLLVGTIGLVPVLGPYAHRPVARWFVWGTAAGGVIGWVAVLALVAR